MSKKTAEVIRKETKTKLSKYGSPQLLAKLEKGGFIGVSEEVALEILEEREKKKETADNKGSSWAKNGSHKKVTKSEPEEEEQIGEEEEESIEKEEGEEKIEKIEETKPLGESVAAKAVRLSAEKKAAGEKVVAKEEPAPKAAVKKPTVKKTSFTGEELDQQAAIVAEKISKSDKIRKLHALGLSVSQISKVEGLDAIYQQVRGVVKKMES